MVLAEVVLVLFALVFWINSFSCAGKDTFETVLAGVVLVEVEHVTDVAVEEVDGFSLSNNLREVPRTAGENAAFLITSNCCSAPFNSHKINVSD